MNRKSKSKSEKSKTEVEKKVSSTTVRSSESSVRREFRFVTYSVESSSTNRSISERQSMSRLGTSTDAIRQNPFNTEFGGGANRAVSEYCSPYTKRVIRSDAKVVYPPNIPAYNTNYPLRSSTVVTPQRLATPNSSGPPTYLKPFTALGAVPKSGIVSTGSQVKTSLSNPVVKTGERLAQKKEPKLEPGVVYIFNQEKFDNEKEMRVGTDKDVAALRQTFHGLFKMQTNIFKDLTVKGIKKEIANIEKKDFAKKSCIVIVILTHGTRHDVVCARDGNYSIDDDMLFPMLNNKSLTNKPKIFIIQACKGDYATKEFVYADAKPCSLNAPVQIAKLYSTFEGFLSYRGDSGSLFIQIFCENLKKNKGMKTVLDVMGDTIHQIIHQYGARQVPTITHNLTIPLKFEDYV